MGRDPDAACAEALRSTRPYDGLLAWHLADHCRARGSGRLRTRRDVLPVRALPADRELAAGQPAREPPGPLERRREPRLGQQVHDQHQHRDELLAGRGDEPRRVPRAACSTWSRSCASRVCAPRGPTTGRAASSPTTTRTSGGWRRRSTGPAGGCGRWAPPGSRRTSSSTTPSAAIPRSSAGPVPC